MVTNLIYPDSQDGNCPGPHPCLDSIRITSDHYMSATAPDGNGCTIQWHWGAEVVDTTGSLKLPISWDSEPPAFERALAAGETFTNSFSKTTGYDDAINNHSYTAKAHTALTAVNFPGIDTANDTVPPVPSFVAHCQ